MNFNETFENVKKNIKRSFVINKTLILLNSSLYYVCKSNIVCIFVNSKKEYECIH